MNAKICRKPGESTKSSLRCFIEAASPEAGVGQINKARANHLSVAGLKVNFERFTQMGDCRVPLFQASLGHRKAHQQVSPLSWLNGPLMRHGDLETAPRLL